MGDRTEREESRFLREHSRRLKIRPLNLAKVLEPNGFFLVFANRSNGMNQIDLVRRSPDVDGLFDRLTVHGNIAGDDVSVSVLSSITPSEFRNASTDAVMGTDCDLTCRTEQEARVAEQKIEQMVVSSSSQLRQQAENLSSST